MELTIGQLLKETVEYGASDLHISAFNPPIIRLKGGLVRMKGYEPLSPEKCEKLLLNILTSKQNKQLNSDKEIDFAYALQDLARFRVNVFIENNAIGAVFRKIPAKPFSIEELGVPTIIKELVMKNHGLILVTGPTGCGKSSTLAAIVDYLNSVRNAHIVTIEEPIEYTFKSRSCLIRQREVGPHTHSFAQALRSCLRQDPDIILVGEMRDKETIETALIAAETGQLVMSTLHTNNAVDAINRIIDVFGQQNQNQIRFQLAATLEGILSQQLIPDQEAKGLGGNALLLATEVLVVTPAIRNTIRENKTYMIRHAIETGSQHQMQTMELSLKKLYEDGKISLETAMRYAFNVDDLKHLLGVSRKAPNVKYTGKDVESMIIPTK